MCINYLQPAVQFILRKNSYVSYVPCGLALSSLALANGISVRWSVIHIGISL